MFNINSKYPAYLKMSVPESRVKKGLRTGKEERNGKWVYRTERSREKISNLNNYNGRTEWPVTD